MAQPVDKQEPLTFRFADDGLVPNHPRWPMLVYPGAVPLPDDVDPAAVFEDIFGANGWGDSWRNGIYGFVHYHSRIHEVLGIARGAAEVRFGGDKGKVLQVKAGDVAVLPAGTGHQRLSGSADLLVVGAYPPFGTYDLCRSPEQHAEALRTIPTVGRPDKDPLFGGDGPLLKAWSEG
ncbi:cupin [Mesorhizobium sp. CA8]|uniref:cupin n=1 Tax=Mesorhizobium sp. CA8 TaxID=2876637 RepID=UPI001CCD8FCD|nr:cupin [Mesorhizobium sp. CA8]MBZ9761549.1 cupin [Mesorhizobium sp. CA8]